jgi:hypothetical protein
MSKKNLTNRMIDHSVSGKNKEDLIHSALREYGFQVFREVKYQSGKFDQKYHERNIDIKYQYGKMERYLESDGKVHGDLENPTQSTLKRNSDFEKAKIPYTIINHESIRELRKIMGLKNVTVEELTKFLVVYNAWQEYSKHLAKIEAGEYFI